MEKSTSIKNIAAALLTFQVKVDKIRKDAKNPFFNSSYASLPHIQEAIHDALVETNLVYSQLPDGENGLTTLIMHTESGEYLQSTYTMRPVKQDPQGVGSCITYQKRYALVAALGLTIDEDDDGNTATHGSKIPESKQNGTPDKPWLNEGDANFAGAIKKLKAGTTTIEKIETVFKLSKAVRAKLEEATLQTA